MNFNTWSLKNCKYEKEIRNTKNKFQKQQNRNTI